MFDEIELITKGTYNHLKGVLFSNENKFNTLSAIYLPKQKCYIVSVTSNSHQDSGIYYYKLVPYGDKSNKYCKLSKSRGGYFYLKTHCLDVYTLTSEGMFYLLEKEVNTTNNAIRKEVEKLRGTTFTDEELKSIILPILNSQGLQVVPKTNSKANTEQHE